MPSVDELKSQLLQAARRLFDDGAISRSGHGNMSARVDADRIVITGTGSLRNLKAEDLAVVRLDGKILEGRVDPLQLEIVTMHTEAYKAREAAGAVIHTHAPKATAFAMANKELPLAYESMLRWGFADHVPVAGWAPRGSKESVSNITELMRERPKVPAVLLGNHGLLAFSRDPLSTVRVIAVMEEGAEMILGARLLGGERPLPEGAFEREHEHMRAHEGGARA